MLITLITSCAHFPSATKIIAANNQDTARILELAVDVAKVTNLPEPTKFDPDKGVVEFGAFNEPVMGITAQVRMRPDDGNVDVTVKNGSMYVKRPVDETLNRFSSKLQERLQQKKPIKPIPSEAMNFEAGMNALAANLADQLENSNISNVLNKIVINPMTKKKQLKKIVIDPFIDVESGYPVKINSKIKDIISREIEKRFDITGEMDPDNLEISEYVLNGMVSIEEKVGKQGNIYKVNASVFEKASGKVLASAAMRVSEFNTTPMDIYKDSPVYLKGKSYEQHLSSVKKMPNEEVDKDYQNRLMLRAMLIKGDLLYEQREFKKSLSYYNQVAGSQTNQPMEVLNGQFTNLVQQGQWAEAGEVYGKLARASVHETNEITSKITFGPNSRQPLESKVELYNIYIKQIANLVASVRSCKIKIIGHASKTGTESYNDNLSLQRAAWIQKKMETLAPEIMSKSQIIGRGFRENIVGTGADDLTDEIDRRVEFKFIDCT
jgi:outer membrane protein OmpA-like peptidoglycan-associated protein